MTIFESMYAHEINFSIVTFWDGGFDLRLGDALNGWFYEENVRTWAEVEPWFEDYAKKAFPSLPLSDECQH